MGGIVYSGYLDKLPLFDLHAIGYPVVLQRCKEEQDYELGLRSIWAAYSDIVIVEHDMRVEKKHIDELLSCPYILCAFSYLVYPATTGEKEPRYAHAHRIPYDPIEGFYRYVKEGDQFCGHAGFGCTKLGRLARGEIDHWEEGTWHNLDTRISAAFFQVDLPYHIHWPIVEHEHKEKI